ncbi:haloalkane dehalogenase [Oxalobacteraceae bacterium OTU3CAMAD1]|nr:haloalkane dehalogenase [Oxalobacteraceae bacterium OTU3CAMAD1]
MQHIFIELWKFKDSWHQLGVEGRAAYVEKLVPAVQGMLAAGVEIVSWGYNEQGVDQRVDYDVFAVYRLPNRALYEQLQSSIRASGWYEYFHHVNAGGVAMSPQAILGEHIALAPPSTFSEDIGVAMTGERHTIEVNGLNMSVAVQGRGRPIVFLHGDIGQAYMWRNVMPYAASHGQAIGVDLIGMGASAKLPDSRDGAYSFDTHYRYLEQLLAQMGVTKDVVFVTHDWGSNLAFEWAMNHPGAVAGIAYCEPVTPPFDWSDWTPMIEPLFRGLQSEQGEAMQLANNAFVEALPMGVLRTLAPAELAAWRRPFEQAGEDRRPALDWPRQVPLGGARPDVRERVEAHSAWMARSSIPKLFMRGEPGALTFGKRLEALRQWKEQKEVAVRGVHWLPEDDPHAMGRALNDWLGTLGR